MLESPSLPSPPPARFDLDAEIGDLREIIGLSSGGGSFSVALCNSVPLRRRIIERLRASFPALRAVTLPPGTIDAFEEASRVLDSGEDAAASRHEPPDAVMVDGFYLIDPVVGPRALSALNLSRELWQRRWPCAIIFWITSAELPALIRGAPDLWAWKSHLFEFIPEETLTVERSTALAEQFRRDATTIPMKLRPARREELRQRLAESAAGASIAQQSRRAAWSGELASIARAQGDYREAVDEFERASALADAAADPRSSIRYLDWAAFTALEREDVAKADSLAHRTLASAGQTLPSDDPMIGTIYATRALIQRAFGDLQGAREWLERAIALHEKNDGPDRQRLASALANLAVVSVELGTLPEAFKTIEQAIVLYEKHYEPDYPGLASCYTAHAGILLSLGDLPGALAELKRSLAILEKHYPIDHPSVADNNANLAIVLTRLGDANGARGPMEQAIHSGQKH